MEDQQTDDIRDCLIKLRTNPRRWREKVYIGCGAGFGGDRPLAALKLLQRVKELNYLVLECLAERTLADRYQSMITGADGYDSRIADWMHMLLPLAVERGTRIITNMGAMDPLGAQEKVIEIAGTLGLSVIVAVAHEVSVGESGISTYLGSAPIVECLEKYKPDVIITSRIADAALFLGPMIYELGWNWDDLKHLAKGTLAGHLLECGCQLTGGYFMHPGDKHRDLSFSNLLDLSLPYVEVSFDGEVYVAKAEGSGGILNFSTCAQQLLYEIGDPSAYVTPDVVLNIQDVTFQSISNSKVLCTGATPSAVPVPCKLLQLVPKDCGWKAWGEISYGGYECVKRATAAEFLVRSWMEEVYPGVGDCIVSYIIGLDSLKARSIDRSSSVTTNEDVRLRMDGLFELKEQAIQLTNEFTALYTNGPAGGGGISTGHKKEIVLQKELIGRDHVYWRTWLRHSEVMNSTNQAFSLKENSVKTFTLPKSNLPENEHSPAPSGQRIPLYDAAHSRTGDKGNDLNFSIIPHFPPDIERLKLVITPPWVKGVVSNLLNTSSFPSSGDLNKRDKWIDEHVKVEIYEVKGIHSLNVVVRNILDGGVNCSRRIDRHGKTISDVILRQEIVLPP